MLYRKDCNSLRDCLTCIDWEDMLNPHKSNIDDMWNVFKTTIENKPHTHSNPTSLALFRHKITLYGFNLGGSYYCRGIKWEQGAEPPEPPPPHFNHWTLRAAHLELSSDDCQIR